MSVRMMYMDVCKSSFIFLLVRASRVCVYAPSSSSSSSAVRSHKGVPQGRRQCGVSARGGGRGAAGYERQLPPGGVRHDSAQGQRGEQFSMQIASGTKLVVNEVTPGVFQAFCFLEESAAAAAVTVAAVAAVNCCAKAPDELKEASAHNLLIMLASVLNTITPYFVWNVTAKTYITVGKFICYVWWVSHTPPPPPSPAIHPFSFLTTPLSTPPPPPRHRFRN